MAGPSINAGGRLLHKAPGLARAATYSRLPIINHEEQDRLRGGNFQSRT